MTGTDRAAEEAQAYFEAIERVFVRLRGAPLLLSPTDWQVAKGWFEARIPLGLVQESIELVFARREERGAQGRIQSLRYCEEEVRRAWDEARKLEAGGFRKTAVVMDVNARLSALAGALPAGLPDGDRWRSRIMQLSGSADEVELGLAEMDSDLLEAAERALDSSDRDRLASRAERALASLRDRVPETEIESARDRVRRGVLRELAHLPLLSLFSPEAQSGEKVLPAQG